MAECTKYMLILALFTFWPDTGNCQSPCVTNQCQPPQLCLRFDRNRTESCLCPYVEKPTAAFDGTCEKDPGNTCPVGVRFAFGQDCFCTGATDSSECYSAPSSCGGCKFGTEICSSLTGTALCYSTTRRFLPACDDPLVVCKEGEVCEEIDDEAKCVPDLNKWC